MLCILGLVDLGDKIIPDYSLSPEEVYRHTVLAAINRKGYLDALFYKSHRGYPSSSSSWMPDWSKVPAPQVTMWDSIEKRVSSLRCFQASGTFSANAQLLENGVLALKGVAIDDVVQVCALPPGPQTYFWSKKELVEVEGSQLRTDHCKVEEFAGLFGDRLKPYVSGGDVRTAFWMTCYAWVRNESEGFLRLKPSDYETYQRWRTWIEEATDDFGEYPHELWSCDLLNRFINLYHTRRFFKTRKGNFGLGLPDTAIGDKVFILAGGRAPFVLRPEERTCIDNGVERPCHSLVGFAYLHGMMDGEGVEGIKAGKEEWQDVYLC